MTRAPILRFVLRVAVFLVPIVAWQGVSLAAHLDARLFPYQVLQQYQEAKLAPNPDVETVLLGDSSLGMGIDAAQFSQETGSPTVNLALTGLYGYTGSANMLARAAEVYPNLRNVVIVNTPDMLSRGRSSRGQLLTMNRRRLADLDRADVQDAMQVVGEALRLMFSTEVAGFFLQRGRQPLSAEDVMDGDYARQIGPQARPRVEPWAEADVKPDKVRALTGLADLARDLGLNAVYAHGPLWQDQLTASRPYLDAADRAILASGLTLVPGTEPIPTERLGNAPDHVAPRDRAEVTSRYATRIKPHLR